MATFKTTTTNQDHFLLRKFFGKKELKNGFVPEITPENKIIKMLVRGFSIL